MLVAGEASGDKHGGALAVALRRVCGGRSVELFGSGGREMRAAGVDTVVDALKLGIIGIPEIIRALPKFYKAYRNLVAAARARHADAIVLIDWPDFNLRLARRLSKEGFKIIYYISPQVWAWRKYRVRAIRRSVKRMLVILPFEEEFYRREGVEAEYVGHPLSGAVRVTSSRDEFAERHGLDAARPIIALLPGSRQKELHYHLPIMAEAAVRLTGARVDWGVYSREPESTGKETKGHSTRLHQPQAGPQFVVPLASTVDRAEAEAMLGSAIARIKLIEQDTYDALGHSLAAVVASGTATVEAALLGVPMVIIYRGSELNWRLIKPMIKLDTFGMANLIAGRKIVPELIQHDATPENIVSEMVAMLADRTSRRSISAGASIPAVPHASAGTRPNRISVNAARVAMRPAPLLHAHKHMGWGG